MNKIAVVYWSGTGNTETMANMVAEGARLAGCQVNLFTAAEFSAEKAKTYDSIAFGCPSMGAEQLEESEFEPMFAEVKPNLGGKKIALFGSYGWGDGEWMRNWEDYCNNAGFNLVCPCVIANEYPDDQASELCKELGAALAQ